MKEGKDWEGAEHVDSYRAGRIFHMEESVKKIAEIQASPDPAAALQAWSQRLQKAIDGAKT